VAVPVLVAYARLYRGMHHPTDVMGAYVNGLACVVIASAAVLNRLPWGERTNPRPAPLTAGAR
ncbi:MAG TPA: phosphatase PAP2 family protein, partial [Candidatus Eisenbacteria bacterium]|nr:phosphatase PAP2 family protein [Candidatus Eisenbacteria bacterium]